MLSEIGSKFSKVITIEDGVKAGGMGSAVLEYFSDKGTVPHLVRLGLPDSFVPHGSVAEERRLVGLDNDSIVQTISSLLKA